MEGRYEAAEAERVERGAQLQVQVARMAELSARVEAGERAVAVERGGRGGEGGGVGGGGGGAEGGH